MALPRPNQPLTLAEERRAERTLLMQTINLSPEDLAVFLANFGIPELEYKLLLEKYHHLIPHLKELQNATNK